MNKKFLTPILILSLMAIGFAGCMDDNTSALPEGTEFDFGAAVEFNRTRTYYDPGDVANPAATSWKIFWNYEAPLDHIYVYSPQGATGCNQASYTVNATEENMSEPAPVTKDGSTGVQLGTSSSYNFYAMYPASAVTAGSGSGTTLSATMPIKQTASTTEKMTTEPVGELQTAADMNCALMIATEKGHTATTEKVSLQFEPFATMLDITVNGIDNNTNSKVRITSVIIEANDDAPIAGDFTYDYENNSFAFGANASNSISIETMFADADGNKVGVMMGNGSTLKVRAFMIPNPNVKSLKVKVVTADSRIMTKGLVMDKFKKSQIHFVKLPKIDVKKMEFDYSIWLSQLDPDIYISEISMPGSALSFNYVMPDDVKKTQTLNVTEQFDKGVRVFQCHVNIINQTSLLDDKEPSVGIAKSDGSPVPKSDGTGYWTIGDMLKVLRTEMAGIHRDEFCVLAISDWIAGVDLDKMKTLYSRLKVVLDAAGREGVIATGINPNTTIDDIKGKIIIKVQLNGSYPDAWGELTGANVWMNIFRDLAHTSVFYSPMPFATFPNPSAGGTSDWYLTEDMNIIYSDCAEPLKDNNWDGVQRNATAVLAAYARKYSSNAHKDFSMTYLGGCGVNGYSPSQVAQTLNRKWLDYSRPEKKPWGWVMFNCVGTESTTTQGIQAVIEHNASPDFILARRSAAKTQPSGDTQGTANGGSIFY